MQLYRVQDSDGRGPCRPGFSVNWIDPDKDDSLCPPMMAEFSGWQRAFDKARRQGFRHFGCAVRGIAGLHSWFTPAELIRLLGYGYQLVDASTLYPLLDGKSQTIVAARLPLRMLPALSWGMAE